MCGMALDSGVVSSQQEAAELPKLSPPCLPDCCFSRQQIWMEKLVDSTLPAAARAIPVRVTVCLNTCSCVHTDISDACECESSAHVSSDRTHPSVHTALSFLLGCCLMLTNVYSFLSNCRETLRELDFQVVVLSFKISGVRFPGLIIPAGYPINDKKWIVFLKP